MAKVSMSKSLKEVMMRKSNWFAPESMQLRERKKIEDIKEAITINQVIVSNRLAKDDDGKVVMSKDGSREIYNPQIFVAFDDNYYFTSVSRIMISQFEALSDEKLVYYEAKDVEVKGVSGLKVKIGYENQKYGSKTHSVPVLVDAE